MAAMPTEERDRLTAYMQKHGVEDIIQKLVEGLLKDKPETSPQEHWAHMLRLEQIRKSHKGEAVASYAWEEAASEVPGRLLTRLFEGTKRITSEIMPKETVKLIISETLALLHCDRVSLFIYDKRLNMLKLNASNLDVPIRVKPGQGIAGSVFTTKETINIKDCYADSRFDQTFDKMTGYTTRCLLTMPIIDFEGECQGVLQAINKLDEPCFNHVDHILLENLTQHVSVCLRNADLYMAAIVTSERSNALLSMIQSLSQDLGAQSTMMTISMHASALVQADRCTVFLVDEGKQQLQSVSTDSGKEIRIPKSAGIAGQCATECKVIRIDDCYADSRFNQAIDKLTGYTTTSMLVVPVLRRTQTKGMGNVLAVLQMINKMEFDGEVGKFDDEDVEVMETCSGFIASKLEASAMIEKMGLKKQASNEADGGDGAAFEADGLHRPKHHRLNDANAGVGSIGEEPEDGTSALERQQSDKRPPKRGSLDCQIMEEGGEGEEEDDDAA